MSCTLPLGLQKERRSAAWVFAIPVVALVVLYWDSFVSIFLLWSDWVNENYSHGFLVLGISLYMVWRRRAQLASIPIEPNFWVVAPLAVASVMWMVARLTGVQMVELPMLVVVCGLTAWSLLGNRIAWLLVFPFAYLLFALPIWEPLIPLLQTMTAHVAALAMRAIGVPTLLQGHYILIPEGTFYVEQSCSGARYFNASLALGFLYAWLNYQRPSKRAICIAISAIVPIIANWLRVFFVILAGHLTDMTSSLVHSHIVFGWELFGVILLPLAWFGVRYSDDPEASTAPPPVREAPVSGRRRENSHGIIAAALLATVALAAGPVTAMRLEHSLGAGGEGAAHVPLPQGHGSWRGPEALQHTDWKPVFNGSTAQVIRKYTDGTSSVYVSVAYYHRLQQQGGELVGYGNSIAGGNGWRSVGERGIATDGIKGFPVSHVRETEILDSGGHKRLVWDWYVIAGHSTTNRYVAKALDAWGLLTDNFSSADVAVAVDAHDDPAAARDLLREFLASLGGPLQTGIVNLDNAAH